MEKITVYIDVRVPVQVMVDHDGIAIEWESMSLGTEQGLEGPFTHALIQAKVNEALELNV